MSALVRRRARACACARARACVGLRVRCARASACAHPCVHACIGLRVHEKRIVAGRVATWRAVFDTRKLLSANVPSAWYLRCHGLDRYGLDSDGLDSEGLYSYGLYSHGHEESVVGKRSFGLVPVTLWPI